MGSGDQEAEHRALRVDRFHLDPGMPPPIAQPQKIVAAAEFDTDQRRTELTVRALHVLEVGDVVVRAKHIVEEAPQGSCGKFTRK